MSGASAGPPRTVLFVDHARNLGGAERSLLLLIKHMDRSLWRPHLACRGGALAERAAGLGADVSHVDMPRLRRSPAAVTGWPAGARHIAAVAREVDADVVHTNTVRATLYGVAGAAMARTPCVWHLRDLGLVENQPRRPRLDRLAKRVIAAGCAEVIANSHATAEVLPKRVRVAVVHNAVPVDWLEGTDGRAFRAANGIARESAVVGTVGRLRSWKGQDRFLRAMAAVADAVPGSRFLVVGGTVFEPADDFAVSLRHLADELGLADRIVFTGHLDDVRPALAAMDVFVHAGSPEPFGLVNIEAMAAGVPVVAFAHGGIPEIVEDGRTGHLVTPYDERALAEAVTGLLRDPDARALMSARAQDRARSRFSPGRMAADVGEVWTRVVAGRAPR